MRVFQSTATGEDGLTINMQVGGCSSLGSRLSSCRHTELSAVLDFAGDSGEGMLPRMDGRRPRSLSLRCAVGGRDDEVRQVRGVHAHPWGQTDRQAGVSTIKSRSTRFRYALNRLTRCVWRGRPSLPQRRIGVDVAARCGGGFLPVDRFAAVQAPQHDGVRELQRLALTHRHTGGRGAREAAQGARGQRERQQLRGEGGEREGLALSHAAGGEGRKQHTARVRKAPPEGGVHVYRFSSPFSFFCLPSRLYSHGPEPPSSPHPAALCLGPPAAALDSQGGLTTPRHGQRICDPPPPPAPVPCPSSR